MELNLKNKRALVTGGSHGIGLAIKKALKKEGVKVISWSRREGVDLLETVPEILDDIDILINNVGGIGSLDYDWNQMKLNYEVMIELTYEFLKQQRRLIRENKQGIVITISSIYGKEAGPSPGFTAAKASQIAFMKSMSKKGYDNIRFNTVCPGFIDVGKTYDKEFKIQGKPEDVANLVVFLCSNKASHINGACITIDGGESYSF